MNGLQFAGRYQCLPIRCSGRLISLHNEHSINTQLKAHSFIDEIKFIYKQYTLVIRHHQAFKIRQRTLLDYLLQLIHCRYSCLTHPSQDYNIIQYMELIITLRKSVIYFHYYSY
jgi:hypothetical protein